MDCGKKEAVLDTPAAEVLRVLFMHTLSPVHHVFVKDYVSCLSMLCRHTLETSGASAFALLRCGGGDGKRLAGCYR